MYCIGKKTRHQEGDVVNKPPYQINSPSVPVSQYEWLRSSVFPTKELAEEACRVCTLSNPVGFVILEVKPLVIDSLYIVFSDGGNYTDSVECLLRDPSQFVLKEGQRLIEKVQDPLVDSTKDLRNTESHLVMSTNRWGEEEVEYYMRRIDIDEQVEMYQNEEYGKLFRLYYPINYC